MERLCNQEVLSSGFGSTTGRPSLGSYEMEMTPPVGAQDPEKARGQTGCPIPVLPPPGCGRTATCCSQCLASFICAMGLKIVPTYLLGWRSWGLNELTERTAGPHTLSPCFCRQGPEAQRRE